MNHAVFSNAQAYDMWYDRHEFDYNLELEAIAQLVPMAGVGIEIGVGTGRFAVPLGISIGIEPNMAMGQLAKYRGVNVLACTAESLAIADELFDYALMVTTTCFLDQAKIAFEECKRILKNSGSIIVGIIEKNSVLGRRYITDKNHAIYQHARFHSVDEMTNLLGSCGFRQFQYRQAILTADNEEPGVREQYGNGSFVAIKAQKQGL